MCHVHPLRGINIWSCTFVCLYHQRWILFLRTAPPRTGKRMMFSPLPAKHQMVTFWDNPPPRPFRDGWTTRAFNHLQVHSVPTHWHRSKKKYSMYVRVLYSLYEYSNRVNTKLTYVAIFCSVMYTIANLLQYMRVLNCTMVVILNTNLVRRGDVRKCAVRQCGHFEPVRRVEVHFHGRGAVEAVRVTPKVSQGTYCYGGQWIRIFLYSMVMPYAVVVSTVVRRAQKKESRKGSISFHSAEEEKVYVSTK